MISIDYTLLIQIANFLVLLLILNIILYRPIRSILSRRKEEIHAFETTIKDFLDRFAEDAKKLEENMVGVRKEGYQEKEACKNEGLETERNLLQEAMMSSGDQIAKAKETIGREVAAVRQSLENEIAAFSRELATKILGRSV